MGYRIRFILILLILFLFGCQKETGGEVLPTAAVVAPSLSAPTGTPSLSESDISVDNEALLPIEEAANEIDQSVCREALLMWDDLLSLEADGSDMSEFKTAVLELISELPDCPTPQPE